MKKLLILLVALLPACHPRQSGALFFWPRSLESLTAAAHITRDNAENFESAARQAAAEERPGAERLLRALAHAERIQETGYVRAIRRMGGSYAPPEQVLVKVRSTRRNMERILAHLQESRLQGYQTIDDVLKEGNRYVARLLIRNAAATNRCMHAVERYMRQGERAASAYWVCPQCGYLCDDGHRDPYCPQCLTDGRRFLRF